MFDFIGTSHTQLYGLPTTQLSALYSILLSSTNFVLDLISIILLFAYVSLVLFSLLWVSNLVPDALPGFITENPNRRPGCARLDSNQRSSAYGADEMTTSLLRSI